MTARSRLTVLTAGVALFFAVAGTAQPADWGRKTAPPQKPGLYWEKCGGCHGSAGTFAPGRLVVANGMLRLKGNGRPLAAFLEKHPVKITEDERRALLDTLASVVRDGAAFRRRCGICHGQVETLARSRLVLRDGVLVDRDSGRDIAQFLERHARLDAESRVFFLAVLKRFAGSE